MSKITNDVRLNPAWLGILYSCTHVVTVGVKGLKQFTAVSLKSRNCTTRGRQRKAAKTTEWVKKNPALRGSDISFFHKRLSIFNRFFTHLLHVPIYAILQSCIQLSPILTKLCHFKRDYPVHTKCSKCPPSAEQHAFRRLCKSLLIIVCGKSL